MKKVNIHSDYVLWLLISQLRSEIGIVCSYMQKTTPYGPEYEAAFKQYEKVNTEIAILESKLADCVEARNRAKKEG